MDETSTTTHLLLLASGYIRDYNYTFTLEWEGKMKE